MADHTRNLSPNTVAFSCLEKEVAILIVDVIAALVSVLRWRQVSQSLLIAILCRLAEAPFLEITHADFSAALWPNLKESARDEKFSKWLHKFKEDMILSNCFPVEIPPPRKDRHLDGSFKTLPTRYLPGIFWNLFHAVQDAALEIDLFALEKDKRRAKVRAIVKEWLIKFGCKPIERYKKDEKTNPPKPSLPCRCACPSCATCAAKAPASEPEKKAEIRITKEGVEDRLHSLVDAIYDCGVDWMNLDLEHSAFAGKLVRDFDEVVMRLREGVKRHNTPRKLKLIGGQAK